MAKKKSKSKKQDKEVSHNLYMPTTIFAVVGTLIYLLLVWLIYPSYLTVTNAVIFFVVVWIVYYFLVRSRAKKY